ncbi:unnamed protein product [Cyclocybe aegerita]|uniref:Proline dehydrogenase n=1 Tax=Cyclocybe aegerita TaxID=1973307 RepID=A0A8S0VSS7_CYCAE|nr:unnamed protein product [Cyclocybe aegerita]
MFRVRLRSPPFSSRLHFPTNHRRFTTNGSLMGTLFSRRAAARVTLLTASSLALATTVYADSDVDMKPSVSPPSLASMVRAYSVFAMCSIPGLVEASPTILSALSSIPGLKQITEAFVRVTFFDQFVGADTADETIPLLRTLRAGNKGAIFAYSVEVDQREATAPASPASAGSSSGSVAPKPESDAHKRAVTEMIHSIDVAGDFEDEVTRNGSISTISEARKCTNERTTWIALKLTALLPHAQALIDLSAHIVNSRKTLPGSSRETMVPFPGFPRTDDLDVVLHSRSNPSSLTPAQIHDLRELYSDLVRICLHARERGVKVIIDAEYSWYQPAVDALTLALMREFNSPTPSNGGEVQPLIYATFQAYLRRTPMQLVLWLEDARKNNYALGAKLVRGAYHPHELTAHSSASTGQPSLSISPDSEPPVWLEKRDTDEAYNRCIGVLIRAVKEDIERSSTKTVAIRAAKDDAPVKRGWFSSILGGTAIPSPRLSESSLSIPQSAPAPMIAALFGTHNWTSCGLILQELVRNGLAGETGRVVGPEGDKVVRVASEAAERVVIGQLYGMRDDLTDWVVSQIVSETPFVLKYVPYGALSEVMPYLSRRAIENNSVLGASAARHERQRAGREIRRLLFG